MNVVKNVVEVRRKNRQLKFEDDVSSAKTGLTQKGADEPKAQDPILNVPFYFLPISIVHNFLFSDCTLCIALFKSVDSQTRNRADVF